MYELTYEISGIDTKTFYGVNNQYFNVIKSTFPTLKITGRDHFIFAMGNQETLDVFKQKLDDVVDYISVSYTHLDVYKRQAPRSGSPPVSTSRQPG